MNKSLVAVIGGFAVSGLLALAGSAVLAQPLGGRIPSTGAPGYGAPRNAERHEGHPVIKRGIRILKRARTVLEHGAHDFGGHRTAAIQHIDQALQQLNVALQIAPKGSERAGEGNRGMAGTRIAQGGGMGGGAMHRPAAERPATGEPGKEKHPEIVKGLRLCQRAKAVLEHGAHDFQGHRADAIHHIDEAISELHLALQYNKR